jgi:hypothetical protein
MAPRAASPISMSAPDEESTTPLLPSGRAVQGPRVPPSAGARRSDTGHLRGFVHPQSLFSLINSLLPTGRAHVLGSSRTIAWTDDNARDAPAAAFNATVASPRRAVCPRAVHPAPPSIVPTSIPGPRCNIARTYREGRRTLQMTKSLAPGFHVVERLSMHPHMSSGPAGGLGYSSPWCLTRLTFNRVTKCWMSQRGPGKLRLP